MSWWSGLELDRAGPVDKRPSYDYLHQFVQEKNREEKNFTCHMTPANWNLTCDTWHVTFEMWHMVGGEHSLKTSAP